MDPVQLKNHLVKHLPEIRVNTLEPLQQGWDSITVLVNHDYVFRFAQRQETAEQYLKESRLLPRLAERIPLELPNVIHIHMEPPPSFIGYRYISGTPLRAADLQGNFEGYLGQLSDLFKSLAEFPLEESPENLPVYEGKAWRNRYVSLYETVRLKFYSSLSEHARTRMDEELSKYLNEKSNMDFEPALIHGDLSSDHIIHDAGARRIKGVIDWGDSCFGDPALDLAGILGDYGTEFASRLLRNIGGSERLLRRAVFYLRLVPIYEVLYGLETGDERRIALGMRRMETSFFGNPHVLLFG